MEDEILKRLCLNISSKNSSVEEVKKELEKISNRGRSEWREHSPLVSAVEAKRKDLIKIMIMDSTYYNFFFCISSVLSTAIENNDEDMVSFLVVEMKAKVNTNKCGYFFDFLGGPSQLTFAIYHKKFQIVKLLVEELGADVNFKVSHNEDGSRPFLALHWAIFHTVNRLASS
jgi:hypothetical protein